MTTGLRSWLEERAVEGQIDSGNPGQDGHIVSHSGRVRDECPNEDTFGWPTPAAFRRIDHNNVRPHSSLGIKATARTPNP